MCSNAINDSGPAYLSELLHVYTPSRTLRSSSDTRMQNIQQYRHKSRGFVEARFVTTARFVTKLTKRQI